MIFFTSCFAKADSNLLSAIMLLLNIHSLIVFFFKLLFSFYLGSEGGLC